MNLRSSHDVRSGSRTPTAAQLRAENEKLRTRLREVSQTLDAIRGGRVDAFVVQGPEGDQVYVLETADHPYRSMVEHMLQGAATLADDGRILYVNPTLAALLDARPEELLDQRFPALFPVDERPVLEELVQRARNTATTLESRLRVRGAEMPVHVAANPLRREATAICAMVTDLTVQRRREALEQADRRKDEFLATLAHELRNPLAPIANAIGVLNAGGASESDRDWARDVIERQVRVMARLLDDLQDVSRITQNRLELRKERVSLKVPLEMALESSRPAIEAAGLELIVDVARGPLDLEGDAVRLSQAFANLLNNAAKYTDRGGRVWLSARREGSDIHVVVRDTGIGISRDALPRVFEMFSQAAQAVQRSQGGIGIGLALVRGLVELHRGSVNVFSEGPGRGSEFIVRLPAAEP